MNNEPVAWMDSLGNLTKQNLGDFIPLYTHPVKEDAQYDKGFDAGVKHGKTIYEAEIEALKEKLNEAIDAEKDRRFE